MDLPGASGRKRSPYNEEDPGSVPGSRRSPGEENGYPLQYSCLGNLRDKGTQTTVHGVTKSGTELTG